MSRCPTWLLTDPSCLRDWCLGSPLARAALAMGEVPRFDHLDRRRCRTLVYEPHPPWLACPAESPAVRSSCAARTHLGHPLLARPMAKRSQATWTSEALVEKRLEIHWERLCESQSAVPASPSRPFPVLRLFPARGQPPQLPLPPPQMPLLLPRHLLADGRLRRPLQL
eukprot:scaffold2129_cov255-Pinguiococcus_pyrenoidosus.AAC.16